VRGAAVCFFGRIEANPVRPPLLARRGDSWRFVPAELGRLGNLTTLDVHDNPLTGSVPVQLCRGASLWIFGTQIQRRQ
jgi:hypothetical protein